VAQVAVYTTQIQCGQSVQLLNVKLVDPSRNQKVKAAVLFVQAILNVEWKLQFLLMCFNFILEYCK
jgi:hypothetical protein